MSSKGGSTSSSTAVPDWIKEPAVANLQRASDIQNIGYTPWYGPDVAGFNPTQQAAMQSNIGAAEAFGVVPQGSLSPMAGMPEQQTFEGGLTGYSATPLYQQALGELEAQQPGDVEKYNNLFT